MAKLFKHFSYFIDDHKYERNTLELPAKPLVTQKTPHHHMPNMQ